MAIIRQRRERNYSIVNNEILNDGRMSFKARGLLIYMLSKPDDWKFYSDELVKHSDKDGISAIRTALNELENCGYLRRIQKRAERGKFGDQDWILNDSPKSSPQVGFPHADYPHTEKPHADNLTLLSTDSTKNLDNQLLNVGSSPAKKSAGKPAEGQEPKTEKDPWKLWQDNWGFPNAIAQQDLFDWIKQFGNDLVTHAIEYALYRSVESQGALGYLTKIFNSYEKNEINTVEKALEDEQKHKERKSRENASKKQYSNKYQPRQKEQLPDWAKEDHDVAEQSDGDQPSPEILKKRADIERRLRESGLKK